MQNENAETPNIQPEAPELNPTEQALDAMKRKVGSEIDNKLEEEEAERVLEAMNNGLWDELDAMSEDKENPDKAARAEFGKLTLKGVEEMWTEAYELIEREDFDGLTERLGQFGEDFNEMLVGSSISENLHEEFSKEMQGYIETYTEFAKAIQKEVSTKKQVAYFLLESCPVFGDVIGMKSALSGVCLDGRHLSPKGRVLEFGLASLGLGLSLFTMGGGSLASAGGRIGAKASLYAAKYGDDVARVVSKGVKYGVKGVEYAEKGLDIKHKTWDIAKDNIRGAKILTRGAKKMLTKESMEGSLAQLESLKAQRDALFSKIVSA